MKNLFSNLPDNSSAIDFFAGLLDSSASSFIDPQFLLLLQRGNPARDTGVSLGNQISAAFDCWKINTKEQDLISDNQKIQRVYKLLTEAHKKNDRLWEEVKCAQVKVSSHKKDMEEALSSLVTSTNSFETEKQKFILEIKKLSEKIVMLNRIIARQEIQLQSLLGEDQSAQNA